MMWAQGGDNYEFEEKLGMSYGYPAVVALSIKKQMFGTLRGTFTESSVHKFVIGLQTGQARLSKLYPLPELKNKEAWDGLDKKPQVCNTWKLC